MGDKFADPKISDQILEELQDTAEDQQPVYPWDLLDLMEEKGYDKKKSRKALRKLRMSNHIVPAPEFIGKVRLAERY